MRNKLIILLILLFYVSFQIDVKSQKWNKKRVYSSVNIDIQKLDSILPTALRSGCNENEFFKNKFFEAINIVEYYGISKTIVWRDFENALAFLSMYITIPFDKYYPRYYYMVSQTPNESFYTYEIPLWLMWYETNKCRYIQVKDISEAVKFKEWAKSYFGENTLERWRNDTIR